MSNQLTASNFPPRVSMVLMATAQVFDVTVDDILSRRRAAHLATARHVAVALCRQLTWHSFTEIGIRFSNRDHGTVIHSVKRFSKISADPRYAPLVQAVRIQIANLNKVSKTSVQLPISRANFLKLTIPTVSASSNPQAPLFGLFRPIS